jgi:type II secretory pathway component PulK
MMDGSTLMVAAMVVMMIVMMGGMAVGAGVWIRRRTKRRHGD